jgi:spore maturation protein CgeB
LSALELRYVFLGLSITSSWGNGHATTYRALLRQLAARGHDVTFLERDQPFHAAHRDLASPPYARTSLYGSFEELVDRHRATIRDADLVVVGSQVPEGARIGAWVQEIAPGRAAFYDIDTPVTLAGLASGTLEYLTPALVSRYALYLSFTGGPTLKEICDRYGAANVRLLYCSADPEQYFPVWTQEHVDLGYLGTYSADRQPAVDQLLLAPARCWPVGRFWLAGAGYPDTIRLSANVVHTSHLAPSEHSGFYSSQRYTLNVTRQAMVEAGWSPSVRLFEAAACGTPIISDPWLGLSSIFEPGTEILVARSAYDVLRYLREIGEGERRAIAAAAHRRFLNEHTAMHRAETLERYTCELLEHQARRLRIAGPAQTRLSPRPGS